ncbi:hypothetical protein [Dactylosporangium sp. CA-233914]|uniref:hypothetical protein n=1 Tax=Dactylosporangium sp. CA-233914 TaxID=3239934 RepID=UPI003D93C60F
MPRWRRRAEETEEPPPVRGYRYANRETAAGVFSRPPAPPRPRPVPEVREEPKEEAPPQLAVRPLRTPAPAITRIRVEAVPVDGFEYETAEPWQSEPEPPPKPPPATPRHVPRPLFGPKPKPGPINWLDE